jgi:hypothetical protein
MGADITLNFAHRLDVTHIQEDIKFDDKIYQSVDIFEEQQNICQEQGNTSSSNGTYSLPKMELSDSVRQMQDRVQNFVNGSMETITSLMISKSYFNNLSQSVSQ